MYRLHSPWKFTGSFAMEYVDFKASIKMGQLVLTNSVNDDYQDHS